MCSMNLQRLIPLNPKQEKHDNNRSPMHKVSRPFCTYFRPELYLLHLIYCPFSFLSNTDSYFCYYCACHPTVCSMGFKRFNFDHPRTIPDRRKPRKQRKSYAQKSIVLVSYTAATLKNSVYTVFRCLRYIPNYVGLEKIYLVPGR